MKFRVKFLGIPGIRLSYIEVEVEKPRVREVVDQLCKTFPEVFPSPSATFQRFLILVEDQKGKTTNIRLKNGSDTLLKENESLVIMPPLTGGRKKS